MLIARVNNSRTVTLPTIYYYATLGDSKLNNQNISLSSGIFENKKRAGGHFSHFIA